MKGLYVVAALVYMAVICQGQSDYIAMIPSELRNGMPFKVDITLFTAPSSAISVNVSVRNTIDNSLAWPEAMFIISFNAGSVYGTGQLTVPYDIYAGTKHLVTLTWQGIAIKPQSTEVEVTRPAPAIFVQTDKGIYKPGDTIMFRVLSTDEYLILKSERLQVIIKDSADNAILDKVADPTDPDFQALVSGEMQLSMDPVFGTYMISAQTNNGYTEATFEVAEYVLPKFNVKIEMDRSFAIKGDNTRISGKVTSKYTYGQMVKGQLRLVLNGAVVDTVTNFEGLHRFDIAVPESVSVGRDYYSPYTSTNLFAEVEEALTEIKANDTKSFTIYTAEFKASEVQPLPFAFEGLTNYTFQVELTDPMGKPLKDWDASRSGSEQLQHYTLQYTLNSGTAETVPITSNPQTITVNVRDNSISLNVWYTYTPVTGTPIEGIHANIKPTKFHTASKEQLYVSEITPLSQGQKCFQITPFSAGDKVFYQVINNYGYEAVTPYTNAAGHCFTPSRMHAPASLVVAFKAVPYVKADESTSNELVATFLIIEMPWTSAQTVTFELSPSTVKPGEDVEITIQAAANSLVGLSGVDKSTTFLADANDITATKLQEAIEQYRPFSRPEQKPGYVQNPPIFRFRGNPPLLEGAVVQKKRSAPSRKKRCIACWDQSIYMDTWKLLQEHAGVVVLTSLEISRQKSFNFDHIPVFDMVPMGGRGQVEGAEVSKSDTDKSENAAPAPRKDFPETWLWKIVQTDTNGALLVTEKVPSTITSWVVNAFALNNVDGLGVAPTKEVTVFQEMFLSMNLPYSVVRGETFILQVLVFNYQSQQTEVKVEMFDGTDYNILDGRVKDLTIAGGASGVAEIEIMATTIGEIELAASLNLKSGTNVDSVVRKLRVKPEGREMIRSANLKIAMPPTTFNHPLDMAKLLPDADREFFVEGSLRMYLKVTGDMMGPFIDNLEGRIRMPYGCGEQNIQTLTPSIFVAKYLKAIDRFEQKIEALVGKVCGFGYRKELIYKHRDGSYSAFGEGGSLCTCGQDGDKKGSTWLTAYVLKTFSLLKYEGLTFVDPRVLKASFDYLNSVVEPDCQDQFFVEEGHLIHKEMMGGSESMIGFSAFCTIAVMDYKETLSGDTSNVTTLISQATTWLQGKVTSLKARKNPFQLAVTAYTLAKASGGYSDQNSVAARDLIAALEALNTREGASVGTGECIANGKTKYATTCTSDSDCNTAYEECCRLACSTDKVCKEKTRRYSYHHSGPSEIETEGYSLMAYVALHQLPDTPAGKKTEYRTKATELQDRLLNKRKDDGFFDSTQDTAVALEALSQYAIAFQDTTGADFGVKARSGSIVVSNSINLAGNNYTMYGSEKISITSPPTDVSVVAEGTKGTAFVTVVAMYNIDTNLTEPELEIVVEPILLKGEKVIHQCVHAKPNAASPVGTMVVTCLNLQSGSQYRSIDGGSDAKTAPLKAEADESSTSVCVYYMNDANDEFKTDRCVNIYYDQVYTVKNRAPGVATVYDYYSPTNKVVAMYSADVPVVGCVGPDCEVAAATSSHGNLWMTLVVAMVIVAMRKLIG